MSDRIQSEWFAATLEDALETLEEAVRLLREDPRKAQGGGRQKFCVQGIIKALKPGKTYEHNQTENQTHLSQENLRNLPARRIY